MYLHNYTTRILLVRIIGKVKVVIWLRFFIAFNKYERSNNPSGIKLPEPVTMPQPDGGTYLHGLKIRPNAKR